MLWIMVAILLLFVGIFILFSIPSFQTYLATKATTYLNQAYDVDLQVSRIGMTYSGAIDLQDILIRDHHEDTLIYAGSVQSSILSFAKLKEGHPALGAVTLHEVDFNMKVYKGEVTDNLMTFVRKFKKKKKATKKFVLTATEVLVHAGHFSYENENLNTPKILDFTAIELHATALNLDGLAFYLKANSVAFEDHRGIKITDFQTDLEITPDHMYFDGVHLKTANSEISGGVKFDFQPGDMSDFVNKVKVAAQFDNATIATNDLIPFYKGFGANKKLTLSTAKMDGTLNDFKLKKVHIYGMDRSVVKGDMTITQLFSKKASKFQLESDLEQLSTNYYDLIRLMPRVLGTSLPKQLHLFGNINVKGNVIVTKSGVDVDVDVFSQLGKVSAFLILGGLDDPLNANYNGNLIVSEFDLGTLLEKKSVGHTSFNLDVDGKGFTLANLDTQLEGTIHKLDFNGYSYNRILVLGNLKDPIFDGQLTSNDPDMQLQFNGVADLSEDINNYDFTAKVAYIDLNKLNLFKRDSISKFKGAVAMKMRGTTINDAVGTISFSKTSYENQNDNYYLDDFEVSSAFSKDKIRSITVNSPDIVEGSIRGIFRFENVYDLFRNAIGSLYSNFEPVQLTTHEFMEFNFNIYNKIVDIFFPQIKFGPSTYIKGKVESDESEFKLTFRSPEIRVFKNNIEGINVQIDNKNPLFNTYVAIDKLDSRVYDISKFSMINVTLNDTLFIRSEFQGGKQQEDKFNLSFFHTINENNKSVLGVRKSDILFKNTNWFLNEKEDKDNRIVFDNKFNDVHIDALVLSHEEEEIRMAGMLRDSTYKDLKVAFKNVQLDHITPAIEGMELSGVVNGELDLLQENGAYYPDSVLEISELSANAIPLGFLQLDVTGNEMLTEYAVNTKLVNDALETLKAIGKIDVSGKKSKIDLDVTLDGFDIGALSPLGKNIMTNIRGLVSGEAKITGNYKKPDINGTLSLNKAGLKIPYLNVDFNFEEGAKVRLSKKSFEFDAIGISTTKYNTKGKLGGFIKHQGFTNWELGLDISSDRLLVLDTEDGDDVLYYGTAFIDGEAAIKGPTDALVIDVVATSEKGTVFKIPLRDVETIGDNTYIHFLSPEEKTARLSGADFVIEEVKGLSLNFDLDINDNAEVEIVVDKNTGSSLRGRGAGTLLIEINTNGKFNMWGDFVAYEGVYNFRYGAFLEKVFNVRSGGSINWDGSPFRAVLDLSAIYSTEANPGILLENQTANRKIPVDVIVNLKGELLQPDLTFDIEFPNTSSVVKSELEYRISDRMERERQALSLVTQAQFMNDDTINESGLITGNLVERASSLVNDIFSDDEDKFQVGLDYVQGDTNPVASEADAAGRLGVSVSTKISDRILINGKVGVPVGGVSESVIVGDVEIQFLLNEEGTLLANIFNRQNDIQYIGAGDTDGYTQGVGLSYSYDFDTFKALIRKIFNTQTAKKDKKTKQQEEQERIPPDFIKFGEGQTK